MTAEQVFNFLVACGIAPEVIRIRDARYVFPSVGWLFITFAQSLAVVRPQFALSEWQEDDGDCDDFEDLAVFYARFLHRREMTLEREAARAAQEEPPALAAIAFGSFEYVIGANEANGAHAINCAIVNSNGAPGLVFFEPQNGQRVDLTPSEICSCQEIRF